MTSRAGSETDRKTRARLREAIGWVVVTQSSHPHVFEAFEAISHDCGAGAGHTNYAVPEQLGEQLPVVERGLATLSKEEQNEFAIGDQTVADKLAKRNADLAVAHKFLGSFFDDWELE